MLLNYSEFYISKNTSHCIAGLLAESCIQLTFYYRLSVQIKKHNMPQNKYIPNHNFKKFKFYSWTSDTEINYLWVNGISDITVLVRFLE